DGESHDSPAPADPADRPPVDAPAGTGPAFFQTPPPAAAGGQVDFEGVFAAAGIDHDERDRVARSSELLASLPSESPVPLRKQIVEAAMKAFGVPLDKIIEAGVQQIQALEGYIRTSAAETDQLLSDPPPPTDHLQPGVTPVRSGLSYARQ